MMSEMLFVLAIIFITVCLPLILVMHYATRWRRNREISRDDELMLEELWEMSQKVEERVHTLERILDSEEREWRKPE
jgi:phage shock protein B